MLHTLLSAALAVDAGFRPEHWAESGSNGKPTPSYPATPPGVPLEFDCAWREYAYEYGQAVNSVIAKEMLFDALNLGTLCNQTRPSAASTELLVQPSSPHANTIYVSTTGDDRNPGTSADKAKRTVASGVLATRALAAPKMLSIAAGTYFLAATVELTAADSGLHIEGAGEVWLSGAQALPTNLHWEEYKVEPASPGVLGEEVGSNNQRGCVKSGTTKGCTCTVNPSASSCKASCAAKGPDACTSYAWSGAGGSWANQCCLRSDGTWAPYEQVGHTSGRWDSARGPLNAWMTKLSPAAAKTMEGSYPAQLRVGAGVGEPVMRARRARHPNANPETDLFPKGWNSADVQWLPPRPTKTKIQLVGPINNSALNTRGTDDFTHYGGGINGPCEVFDPPFSYWCQAKPQGGGGFQYFVPSGFVYAPGSLPFNATTKPLSDMKGWTVQMWRQAHWANWMFDLDGVDTASNTLTLGRGGYQGCRGGNGSEWYVEGDLAFLDDAGEFIWDDAHSMLFYSFNGTEKPTGREMFR